MHFIKIAQGGHTRQMLKYEISVSILNSDLSDLRSVAQKIDKSGAHWLHYDVMDGEFVENITFGAAVLKAIKPHCRAFIDVHLMVDNLAVILPLFMNAGASQITIHAETEPQLLHASLSMIKSAGIRAGVSLCPPTPVANVKNVLELADLVLIMSVTPGFGGQKFIESSLEKVRELVSLRAVHKYNYLIEIDGGINGENITRAALAGCDVLVMGSAVFAQENPGSWLAGVKAGIKEAVK